jgi:hypothetical protein
VTSLINEDTLRGNARGPRVRKVLPHVGTEREVETLARRERLFAEEVAIDLDTKAPPSDLNETGVRLDSHDLPSTVSQPDECSTDATADVDSPAPNVDLRLTETPRKNG